MAGRQHRCHRTSVIWIILATACLGSRAGPFSKAGASFVWHSNQIEQPPGVDTWATRALLADASQSDAVSPCEDCPPPEPSPPVPQQPDSPSPRLDDSPPPVTSLAAQSANETVQSPPQSPPSPVQVQAAQDSPSPSPDGSPSPPSSPDVQSTFAISQLSPSPVPPPPGPVQPSSPVYHEPPASPTSPPVSQPPPEQQPQTVSPQPPPHSEIQQENPPPPAGPPPSASRQQTGTSAPSPPPFPSPNYPPPQSPAASQQSSMQSSPSSVMSPVPDPSPETQQPPPEQQAQTVRPQPPPQPEAQQDCPPPPAGPPASESQQQTGTSAPSPSPSPSPVPSPNYLPPQSPSPLVSPTPVPSPETQQSSGFSSNAQPSPDQIPPAPHSPPSYPPPASPQTSSESVPPGVAPPSLSPPVESDGGSSALAQAPSISSPPAQSGSPPASPQQQPPAYPQRPPPLAPPISSPPGPPILVSPAATSPSLTVPETAPPAASTALSSPPAPVIQSTFSSGFLQAGTLSTPPSAGSVNAAPPLEQHNSTLQQSSASPQPGAQATQHSSQAPSLAPGPSLNLPTATASSAGVDVAYTAQAKVPVVASKAGASQWGSLPVGSRIEPAPEVLAAINAADVPEGDKHLALGIATLKTCPPDTDAAVTLPLGGALLASHTGHTCGTLPAVPQALTSLVSGGYELDVLGSRIGNSAGIVTKATVSLAGGKNASTFVLPQAGHSNWTVSTAAGYNFTVNASAMSVVLDGVSYAIPVTGFAKDNDSSTLSSGGRRLLWQPAGGDASGARHKAGEARPEQLHRRHLAEEPSSMYSIQLVVSKCSSDLPVLGATVNALLSGFTAEQEPFPLQQLDNTSNIYSAPLNLEVVFPNLAYSNLATVNFCTSNQASIETACAVGITNGLTFANTSVLLNACTQFLTNGAIGSVSQAAQQVALACAVVAVEIGLLCSVSSYDCHTLAQDSFTIHVAAEEILPGIIGPNRTISTFGSIYQNEVNGQPGADVLHADNIACADIADGSCGDCTPQGVVAAASMPGIGSRRRLVRAVPQKRL